MRKKDTRPLKEIEQAIRTLTKQVDNGGVGVTDALSARLAGDLRLMRQEDYIPRVVLDGVDGTGGLRSTAIATIPDWEQKYWQGKYLRCYAVNGGRHFDVNDAWDDSWSTDREYDLLRALRIALAKRAHERAVDEIGRRPEGRFDAIGAGVSGDREGTK